MSLYFFVVQMLQQKKKKNKISCQFIDWPYYYGLIDNASTFYVNGCDSFESIIKNCCHLKGDAM